MKLVILGGGISGVTCAQELLRCLESPDDTITLISATPVIKVATNVQQLSRTLETFGATELVAPFARTLRFQTW